MPTITTGRFLSKDEVSEDGSTHTILSVVEQNIMPEDKPAKIKWVMGLSGLKPLVLNTTNINRCIQAFKSKESEDWVGNDIVVYNDPDVEFGGKITGGVRLKSVGRGQKKPAKPLIVTPDDGGDENVPF